MKGLKREEYYKLLPILMEVSKSDRVVLTVPDTQIKAIVWNATDEHIQDVVNLMTSNKTPK